MARAYVHALEAHISPTHRTPAEHMKRLCHELTWMTAARVSQCQPIAAHSSRCSAVCVSTDPPSGQRRPPSAERAAGSTRKLVKAECKTTQQGAAVLPTRKERSLACRMALQRAGSEQHTSGACHAPHATRERAAQHSA
jgi:hypothetical protein